MTTSVQQKIMMTTFWDENGTIRLDFLPDGEIITPIVTVEFWKMSPIIYTIVAVDSKGILLHQDIARPHTGCKEIAEIDQLRWKLISHLPYSTDLVPSDYALFSFMEKFFRSRRFNTKEELEAETRSVLGSFPMQWFQQSIRKLQER